MNGLRAFPRLDNSVALELLTEYSAIPVEALRERWRTEHSMVHWYPTAATRIGGEQLRALREGVIQVAQEHGFPAAIGQRSPALTEFDRSVGPVLHEMMRIIPSDAAHDGVWSFLSLLLLPDVAFWRFPNGGQHADYERILGRPRNVFRRLWWRCHILGSTPESPASRLLEDEAVAILERPTLGSEPRVARAIATVHLERLERGPSGGGTGGRTQALRQAMKHFRRLSSVVALGSLDDERLRSTVNEVFDLVAADADA